MNKSDIDIKILYQFISDEYGFNNSIYFEIMDFTVESNVIKIRYDGRTIRNFHKNIDLTEYNKRLKVIEDSEFDYDFLYRFICNEHNGDDVDNYIIFNVSKHFELINITYRDLNERSFKKIKRIRLDYLREYREYKLKDLL